MRSTFDLEMPIVSAAIMAPERILKWSQYADLGIPVVPEVNM